MRVGRPDATCRRRDHRHPGLSTLIPDPWNLDACRWSTPPCVGNHAGTDVSADEVTAAIPETKDAGAAPENKALAVSAYANKASTFAKATVDGSADVPENKAVRVKHVGHGQWYIVDADDARVAGPFASKAEAEAAL